MRGLASLADEARFAWNDGGIPWFSPSRDGRVVNTHTAFNLSAVWACETLIADAIATLPVDTFRKKAGQRESTTAPVWIDQPNPENNRIDYETQRVLSLLGWGNAYSLLIREGGADSTLAPVLERWILNPAHVVVRRLDLNVETSPIVYWVRGVPVPLANMQHVRGYIYPGSYHGMSVIHHARKGLEMTMSAEQAGATLYDQGMMPGGVLTIPQLPGDVSSQVVDRLRATLQTYNGGAANTGKPLVLTGGTTWSQMMVTPSDAQYLETRKFQINEICRWFRVPPHKVQDIVAHASQGGGMGIEQQAGEFAQDTLLSWVARLEIADSALIPRGQYVKYNLNAYVRADMATRYEAYNKARLGGWMCVDDIRELEEEPPLPDGKGQIFLQPANYIEAGTTLANVPETAPPAPPAGSD